MVDSGSEWQLVKEIGDFARAGISQGAIDARAVFMLGRRDVIQHRRVVPEVIHPDFGAAFSAMRSIQEKAYETCNGEPGFSVCFYSPVLAPLIQARAFWAILMTVAGLFLSILSP